jgi:hypothetical protein
MPSPKPVAKPGGLTAAEKSWIPILDEWKKSGLGVREFCRRRRLRESAFWHGKQELPDRERRRREQRQAGSSKSALRMLPVSVVREPADQLSMGASDAYPTETLRQELFTGSWRKRSCRA